MMHSRFDEITRDQLSRPDSRKWSLHPGTIGAWVAEMDYGTAPVVTAALHRAVDDGDWVFPLVNELFVPPEVTVGE